ncbi:MAG TPA: hypothetical protein VGH11_06030 [Jatrophihabitans sp.]|jgi:hypothetical protein
MTALIAMWEVRAADNRLDDLLSWVLERVTESARVYKSELGEPRVVVIDSTGQAETLLATPPHDLVARAPHCWNFEEVRNG